MSDQLITVRRGIFFPATTLREQVNVRPPLDPSPFLESAPTPVPSENLIHRWPRDAVRYSFIVSDFHRLLLANLPAHREFELLTPKFVVW